MENIYLNALKLDESGDWAGAHELIQDLETQPACWIHAYLHRKEGDDWNAGYWYRRAGKPFCELSLADEWKQIHSHLSAGKSVH